MTRIALKISLLAVLFVGGSELAVRTVLRPVFDGINRIEDFYLQSEKSAGQGPVDVVFIGSSRVTAAISPAVVQSGLSDSLGTRVRVVSEGKGFSTLALHYFGLKRLYRNHPDKMNGALVLVEAPGGIPIYQEWSDKWVTDTWPTLMGPLLDRHNVVQFLSESPNSPGAKAYAVAAAPLRTVRYVRYLQPRLESRFNGRFSPDHPGKPTADLVGDGGIRIDSVGVALVREQVLAGHEEHVDRSEWNWDTSVIGDIVRLVRENGGDVAFYEMPVSSPWEVQFPSEVRETERQSFHAWINENDLAYVPISDFGTTKEDFPDLVHLRKTRRSAFSERVSDGLLESPLFDARSAMLARIRNRVDINFADLP